MQFPQEE
jgi:hypothetical protein